MALGQPNYGVVRSTADPVLMPTRTSGMALAVWGGSDRDGAVTHIRGESRRAGWWMSATSAGWASAGVVAGILSGLMGGAGSSGLET